MKPRVPTGTATITVRPRSEEFRYDIGASGAWGFILAALTGDLHATLDQLTGWSCELPAYKSPEPQRSGCV